jgi:ribokinase
MARGPDVGFDVCVVGSANLDLVATTQRLPGPGETVLGDSYVEHPGGKGLNQVVAAARSGARTAFVGAVGDDDAGRRLREVMRDDGIDASGCLTLPGVPTGRALIGVSDGGENSIIVVPGANALVTVDDLVSSAVVLAQLEVPVDVVINAFTVARARGAMTVLNPAPATDVDERLLSLCDVVVPNEHEVELLGGVSRLLAHGVRCVIVTEGRRGATLHSHECVVHVDTLSVDVVDTTGAGDTFCGTLAARLAFGDAMNDALPYASAAATLSTTRVGAVPSIPRRDEVVALLAR